ncbi:MAG TPA: hypothetical protein VHT48_01995 [Methylocella sp.]|jgi:hypothetical protein|nr:hypothetical protein [Methylocella sp.]
MGDDREERIRDDWYHTYKSWDAADDRRRVERENQITRLGLEGARLGREIERTEQASQLKKCIDDFQKYKQNTLLHIDGIEDDLWVSENKIEWRQRLETIDARLPGAERELKSVLENVMAFKRFRSSYDPGKRLRDVRDMVKERLMESSLNLIESSLNLLIERCQAIRKYMG